MITDIYAVSGFLGAGKTTLIQKLLTESFLNDNVAIIENDFGEVSVDAALLGASGVTIKEMNAGCICCSLSGNFVEALQELLTRFKPEKIIIEPSGVGKLSDVVKACRDPRIEPLARVKSKITVADVKRCEMYLENFGEFFEDQIKNADVIILSRTDKYPDMTEISVGLIKEINHSAPVISQPWEQLSAADILYLAEMKCKTNVKDSYEHICGCGHDHDGKCCHHEHGTGCGCAHDHTAEEVFDTVTLKLNCCFSIERLKSLALKMEHISNGTVLRAKGIVHGANGYLNVQYLPGDMRITDCTVSGNTICFIGHGLSRKELINIFDGEK